jgi:hypothetical protein
VCTVYRRCVSLPSTGRLDVHVDLESVSQRALWEKGKLSGRFPPPAPGGGRNRRLFPRGNTPAQCERAHRLALLARFAHVALFEERRRQSVSNRTISLDTAVRSARQRREVLGSLSRSRPFWTAGLLSNGLRTYPHRQAPPSSSLVGNEPKSAHSKLRWAFWSARKARKSVSSGREARHTTRPHYTGRLPTRSPPSGGQS